MRTLLPATFLRTAVQLITITILVSALSLPAGATIISGQVTGGSALTAGGTFVETNAALY